MTWLPQLSCICARPTKALETNTFDAPKEAELLGDLVDQQATDSQGETAEDALSRVGGSSNSFGGSSTTDTDVEPLDVAGIHELTLGGVNFEGESKGRELWRRVSANLTRINDAATITRVESNRKELEFDESQMTRISLRLDGMDSYSVLGALISGFSLQLISSITVHDFGRPFSFYFGVLFVVFGTTTTVSALYATIIFALCSLHGKAGVGTNKDAGYLKYITSTAPYRESAFIALMYCFVGILATVSCMLFMRTPLFPACIAVAGSTYFCMVATRHVNDIMKLASEHIFS